MDLKSALRRVIKICPKRKDMALFRAVRFVSGGDGKSAGVFASDGACSIYVPVDGQLPDAVVPLGNLASAVKDSGDLTVRFDTGEIELAGFNATYKLGRLQNSEYFPNLPVIPQNFSRIPWRAVQKVLHAAATDWLAELSVVHFGADYVEAIDKVRIARFLVTASSWKSGQGFVPVRLFTSWPKGPVDMAFTESHAFFKIDSEIRIAALSKVTAYLNTDKLLDSPYTGSALVDLEVLQSVVKQATEVSPLKLVMLTATLDNLEIRACDAAGKMEMYLGLVPITTKFGELHAITVDGKFLQQALAQCDTPRVKLLGGQNVDPLRIESGNFVECLWQKYWG